MVSRLVWSGRPFRPFEASLFTGVSCRHSRVPTASPHPLSRQYQVTGRGAAFERLKASRRKIASRHSGSGLFRQTAAAAGRALLWPIIPVYDLRIDTSGLMVDSAAARIHPVFKLINVSSWSKAASSQLASCCQFLIACRPAVCSMHIPSTFPKPRKRVQVADARTDLLFFILRERTCSSSTSHLPASSPKRRFPGAAEATIPPLYSSGFSYLDMSYSSKATQAKAHGYDFPDC
jgi:hypothetical protein